MTTIAIVGASRSLPVGLEYALPADRLIRVDRPGRIETSAEVEVAVGTGSAPELIREVVIQSPRLRWLHLTSAGVDLALMPEVLRRSDLTLTNSSGAFDAPVSEFVLALILAIAKRLPTYQDAQEQCRWDRAVENADVQGSTVVVLGLGHIGSRVARLVSALGMRVIGVRRSPGGMLAGVSSVVGPERLADVAREADYLVITAALTASTRGLVSREVLGGMKQAAWVINVARGEIVDEEALFDALTAKRIAGAALDVWWTEPLPARSDWWQLPNVIATPHVASSSPSLRHRTTELFLENLRRWKAGTTLLNVIDRESGY